MKLKAIIVAVSLLVAFGLGVLVGSRRGPARVATAPAGPPRPACATSPAPSGLGAGADACVEINDAASLIGKKGCVSAQVMRIFTSRGGNTFLDFCQDYRNCAFTSVIFATDKDKFGNLQSLQGMKVEIRGDIKQYRNSAEIVIHDPHQISIAP